MEITHHTRNLRIAPRKLRLVADQIRYQTTDSALGILPLTINKGAGLIFKSLGSAVQVAKDNNLDPKSLIIQQIYCDEGKVLKRSVSGSKGRMSPIMKKYTHLSIVLRGEPLTRSKKKVVQASEGKE